MTANRLYMLQTVLAGVMIVFLLQIGSIFFREPVTLSGDSMYGASVMYGPPSAPKVRRTSTSIRKAAIQKRQEQRRLRMIRRGAATR